MRMTVWAALACGFVGWTGMAQAAKPPAKPQLVRFDFSATVQADGTLADIQPDAALAENLQAMVRRRVATWRYTPLQWQGKQVASPVSQSIKLEIVPVAESSFAFRILGVGKQEKPALIVRRTEKTPMSPPRFPPELMRSGVNAVLVYAVLYDAAGKPSEVELMYPAQVDRVYQRLDAASREAIAKWSVPHTFEGAPIACRDNVPITFQTDSLTSQLQAPPEVAELFDRYTDMCPEAKLETPVAGTFL
ncbi:hypothetical protein [Thermomonas sp. LB-4]|uniref:hypothetical protein n=1 Tax=Thermomonas sp. LB-4 TaxID=3102790 RepID=UPI002EDB46DC